MAVDRILIEPFLGLARITAPSIERRGRRIPLDSFERSYRLNGAQGLDINKPEANAVSPAGMLRIVSPWVTVVGGQGLGYPWSQ